MSDERIDLAELIERLGRLGRSDRRAVLARLSEPDRRAIDEEWSRQRTAAEPRADRQFAGYSPWLAKVIEQSIADDPALPAIGDGCRSAIGMSHRTTLESEGEESILERIFDLLGLPGRKIGSEAERC